MANCSRLSTQRRMVRKKEGGRFRWPDVATRRAPRLSARVMIVRAAAWPAAARIATATRSGSCVVRQAMVDPEPLRKPPSAPARMAALSTAGRNGIKGRRWGWWKAVSAKAPRSES